MPDMSKKKIKFSSSWSLVLWVIFAFGLLRFVQCQDVGDYNEVDNPAVLPLLTQLVYSRLSNLTAVLSREINNRSNFCVKDPEADWNQAFNFSSNLDFLATCIQKTKGDITRRICTAAEMKFYFNSFFEPSTHDNYLKPNKNCNLTSWVSGCEPGWACSVGQDQPVDLENSHNIPARSRNCQTCCEGFFCPHGITCMIPCPLGSYCPLAKLNNTTGVCEPYHYQLPPGQPNHTCGGANIWADVGSSSEIFCSAGSYCPTTVQKNSCSSGHYCRMGSTSEKRCFKLTSCKANSTSQNIHAYGIMLMAALTTVLLIIYNCSDQVITTRERRLAKSREARGKKCKGNSKSTYKGGKLQKMLLRNMQVDCKLISQ
ncbi:ABC transporter G family member 24-like, partial [Hevea brasiliensis]|uniref:ABC transporter G family member 24-like n=1 Tax=Hevea brasiliensis TaxID=3981 RepID=UPI0025EC0AF9